MNQQTPLGGRDRREMPNGDRGWIGVNLRLDPSQLPEGYASSGVNVRFRYGVAESRMGSVVAPWLNKITAGTIQPWSAVYGVGLFRDPNSAQEYVMLAAEGGVYACQPNNPPRQISLPSGVTVTTTCRFQQAFDVVVLFRGFDLAPLAMNDIVVGFQAIEPSPTGTGTEVIPAALRSVAAANRLFVANDNDSLLASDILDYTHYSITNDFRINQGSDDRIVNVAMFGPATIVALKGASVYRVDNVYGSLVATALSQVTKRYGCVAAESVVDCGNDLLWLSQQGVASLTLTSQNEVQAAEGALAGKYPMFSDDIQPLIERINWRYASGATAELWNDYYFLAVPMDQAEVLGPEVAPYGWAPPSSTVVIPVTAGAVYRWEPTATELSLTNGAASYTTSRDFTAAGTSVSVSISGLTFAGSLRRVWVGVNNAVLVYDLRNGAWCGYDNASGIAYSRFFKAKYNTRERLFGLTFDGFVRLLEEDFADRRSQPYVDVTVGSVQVDDTLQVNGGTTVTATAAEFNAGGNQWGISGLGLNTPAANLFTDGAYGYYAGSATTVWSAPNTVAVRITGGIRFISTNGVLPTVTVGGTAWATLTYVVEDDVQVEMVTRGYRLGDGQLGKFTGAAIDVQAWDPSFSLDILADGVNEVESLIADRTRDATNYTRLGLAAYDLENTGDGFYDPYREDYAIAPTSEDFEFLPGANIYGHLHQEAREQQGANLLGRAARLRVTNTHGRIRVMQSRVDMVPQPAPAGSTI